jgi:CDP-diacylglycerol--glycerol-3-phosphate 3-phosphatidyltransferase
MAGVVLLSLLSALDYFWKFWRKVDVKVKKRRRREILIAQRRERLAALRQSKGEGFSGVRGIT